MAPSAALLENGIHKSDLINWFGGTALTVAAEVGSFSGHDDWEDYTVSLIRYDSGAVGILRWGGFLGARGTNETIIDGSKGSLRLDMREDIAYLKKLGKLRLGENRSSPFPVRAVSSAS